VVEAAAEAAAEVVVLAAAEARAPAEGVEAVAEVAE
jgi:hypothetical protein